MTTSKRIATKASGQLKNLNSTKDIRAVAGSDLAQAKKKKRK